VSSSNSTLKKADDVDGALAPELTAWDRKVLAALPSLGPLSGARKRFYVSPWVVAQMVDEDDVKYVRSTLAGLSRRHLVYSTGWHDRQALWVRSHEGDKYLEDHDAR
jgi:hypothetical protein